MTVYGCDASDYDWGRGSFDVGAMARDGIVFLTHKATEAANVKHVRMAEALNRGRAAGIPILGAYHVVRSSPSRDIQVNYFLSYLDQAVSWWRNWPAFILQVDLEKWPYDTVSAGTGKAFTDALRRAVPNKFIIVYASRGQYGNDLAGINAPLWNANYPSSRSAQYRSMYTGDGGAGWGAYSGQTPLIWQFASTATIGSQNTCDINAFRGSLAELTALVSGNQKKDDMLKDEVVAGTNSQGMGNRTADTLLSDIWNTVMRGTSAGGGLWNDSPFMTFRTKIAELQAAAEARSTSTNTAIKLLGDLLAAGGGSVETAAIITAIDRASAASGAIVSDEAKTTEKLRAELVAVKKAL